jgi:hypothetical protein
LVSPTGIQVPLQLDGLYHLDLTFTDGNTGGSQILDGGSAGAQVSEVAGGATADPVMYHLSLATEMVVQGEPVADAAGCRSACSGSYAGAAVDVMVASGISDES